AEGHAGERRTVLRLHAARERARSGAVGADSRRGEDGDEDGEKTDAGGDGSESAHDGSPSARRHEPRDDRSGQVSWLPGLRFVSAFPGDFPEWPRLRGALETGSPATVAGPRRLPTCFPFTLPTREAP